MLLPKISVVVAERLILTNLSAFLLCSNVAEHVHLYHATDLFNEMLSLWQYLTPMGCMFQGFRDKVWSYLMVLLNGDRGILTTFWSFDGQELRKTGCLLPHCHRQPRIHQVLSIGKRAARRHSQCTQFFLVRNMYKSSFEGIRGERLIKSGFAAAQLEKQLRRSWHWEVQDSNLKGWAVSRFRPCLRSVSRWSSWGGRGRRWPRSTSSPCRSGPPCRSPAHVNWLWIYRWNEGNFHYWLLSTCAWGDLWG